MITETLTESPRSQRFESHVAFDNIPLGESTEYNPISFTLNHRHAGFQFRRRHRTFMVGVDDNSYSDHALQWLLDELVDDGDEIVCVRVIETQVRLTDKQYQEDAKALMENIQAKNTQNKAIGLVLEYAVGKLHNTFQHLVSISNDLTHQFYACPNAARRVWDIVADSYCIRSKSTNLPC